MLNLILFLNIFLLLPRMTNASTPKSIYDIEVTDIEGNTYTLEKYKNKAILIVNAASKCGLADKSYKELAQLLKEFNREDFVILIFPCSLMIDQEYNNKEDIKAFVKRYSDDFVLMNKVHGTGSNMHPVFKYLTNQLPGTLYNGIKWNFTYFLIDRNGKPCKRYGPNDGINSQDQDLLACIHGDKISKNGC